MSSARRSRPLSFRRVPELAQVLVGLQEARALVDCVERHEVDAQQDGDLHVDQTELLVDYKHHWTESESDALAQQVFAVTVLELVLDLKEREPAVSCRG